MTIYCQKCGKPWYNTWVNFDYHERQRFFRGEGCPDCEWGEKPETLTSPLQKFMLSSYMADEIPGMDEISDILDDFLPWDFFDFW